MDLEPLPGPPTAPAAGSQASPARRAAIALLAVAGFAGLVAAFTLFSRPAVSDEAVRGSLEKALAEGPRRGSWEIHEPEGARRREFAADAADPSRLLVRFDGETPVKVKRFPREYVAMRVFGEWSSPLFFENYRPEAGRPRDDVGGARAVRVRFVAAKLEGPGPTRSVWVDEESGQVLRLEDRSYDGGLVHAARWLSETSPGWDPGTSRPQPAGVRRRRSWAFEDVVEAAPFPVYEPTTLPPGFQRVGQYYHSIPIGVELVLNPRWGGAVEVDSIDVVELRYSDGLAHMAIAMLSATDMKRLQKVAAERASSMTEPTACAGSEAVTIEDLVDSDDELVVRRHANRCGSVLKVEDIGGVALVLRARNELPPEAYVQAIKSLRPAPGSKTALPGSKPVDDWLKVNAPPAPQEPRATGGMPDGPGGMRDFSAQPEKPR